MRDQERNRNRNRKRHIYYVDRGTFRSEANRKQSGSSQAGGSSTRATAGRHCSPLFGGDSRYLAELGSNAGLFLMTHAADEAAFQACVLEVARLAGWRSLHIRPARRADGSWRTPIGGDGKGWPDLTLVRPPRLLFVELKSERGKLRPEQSDWLGVLRLLPEAEVYLWTPADWDELVEVLTGARPKAAA